MKPTPENMEALLKDFLTVAEAAERLKITPRMVQTAAKKIEGALPAGFARRIPRAWVESRLKIYGTGPIPQKVRPNRQPKTSTTKDLRHGKKSGTK